MENGTILDLLMKANEQGIKISEKLRKHLFRGVLNSLAELLTLSGLCHRDIKPDNFVLDQNLNVKLIDFGWSCSYRHGLSHITGTDQYCAPEVH